MPIIRFDTVSKEFTPESYGLRDISFEVEPGEMMFITGHSGSGKTTLMRMLTKEYTPTSGEIYFHEEPLSVIDKGTIHQHRRRIGVVFQDYRLVPEMNVWENIALPLFVANKKEQEIEQRVTDLLNLIKLPTKADQFPSQLSGGEAQRVSIARALAIGPEVIFADEPTGNLDSETSRSIARLLKKINELGTTVLIATHDPEIMNDHTDVRVIVLENGALITDSKTKKSSSAKASGTTKTVKTTSKESTKSESEKETDKQIESIIQSEPEKETPVEEKRSSTSLWNKLFRKKEKGEDPAETEKLEEESPTPEPETKKEPKETKKPSKDKK